MAKVETLVIPFCAKVKTLSQQLRKLPSGPSWIRNEGLRQKFANKYGIFLIFYFHFNKIHIFY